MPSKRIHENGPLRDHYPKLEERSGPGAKRLGPFRAGYEAYKHGGEPGKTEGVNKKPPR